ASATRCLITLSSTSHNAAISAFFNAAYLSMWLTPRPCKPQIATRTRSFAPSTRRGSTHVLRRSETAIPATVLAPVFRISLRRSSISPSPSSLCLTTWSFRGSVLLILFRHACVLIVAFMNQHTILEPHRLSGGDRVAAVLSRIAGEFLNPEGIRCKQAVATRVPVSGMTEALRAVKNRNDEW